VRGGDGITGLSNGQATATGSNGALSKQHSSSIGGAGSTLVADGKSSATTLGGLSGLGGLAGLHLPGGLGNIGSLRAGLPATSLQTSEVHGGAGITGISNGQSTATGNGLSGANAIQKSIATGGKCPKS